MDWIKSLKPGDKVYLRNRWGRDQGRMATVEKVGRKWLSIVGGARFNLQENRLEDSDSELWQSYEAYEADFDRRRRWRRVAGIAGKVADGYSANLTNGIHASSELLEQVEQLLGLAPKKILIFNPPIRNL